MDERVGTAERDQVVGLLGQALSEGYLGLAEYEHRVSVATAARTTGELVAQLRDLPRRFDWKPGTELAGRLPSAGRAVATRTSIALLLAIGALPLSACYGIGGLLGLAAIGLGRAGLRTGDQRTKAFVAIGVGLSSVVLSIVVGVLLVVVG
ncbi:DUF1707 SHOCT-like domain-containing protein [Solwaraspora sp. WMMB335]|uniref:DUF1707 SHOCT-like domain-containing protein n=1 Tax=Solwaraspora sp. WMMB335 TaxID=3404118 RepID=UPI003B93A9D1